MSAWSTSQVHDAAKLADFLQTHPIRHAYLLGYLDPAYADQCRWYGAVDGTGALGAVLLVYTGLARPALFTAGASEPMAAIVRGCRAGLPESATGHILADHLDAFLEGYRSNGRLRDMSRMGLDREAYVDRQEDRGADVEVVKLSHRDTGAILELYAAWPDHFFEPFQLETGLYFGIRVDGKLVSIAGTHNLSETYDVAGIGNLVTHPDYRGRSLARYCTARLLREAFGRIRLISLDVQKGNEPALRTYTHFGFSHEADFHEGRFLLR